MKENTPVALGSKPKKPMYTLGEEIASAISHGLGAAFAIVATVLLVVRAATSSGARAVVAMSVYGCSMLMLYMMSTLYHALAQGKAKRVFKVLDHASIYFLIAGTYTVFTLAIMGGAMGWLIFGIIWALAALGISLEAFWVNRKKFVSAILYVAMGWLIVFALGDLKASMVGQAFFLLVGGGVLYTLGAVLYSLKRLPWHHPIFHVFVLAGSVAHFGAIWLARW